MEWAVPDIDTKAITVAYRQSRQLHELAQQIASLSGASAADVILPDYVDNDGVAPVLATNMTEVPAIADWLARRIEEIERFVRDTLSIAVVVNEEGEVRTIAAALSDALVNQNTRVIPCSDGQVRGQGVAGY